MVHQEADGDDQVGEHNQEKDKVERRIKSRMILEILGYGFTHRVP